MIKLDQTSAPSSPTASVTGSLSDIVADVTSLAELQFELLQVDTSEASRQVVKPVIVLALAILLIAGCFPIAILLLAAGLYELAGLSATVSIAISLALGLVAGATAAFFAATRIRDAISAFERSKSELRRNVDWLKNLKRNRDRTTEYQDVRKTTASSMNTK